MLPDVRERPRSASKCTFSRAAEPVRVLLSPTCMKATILAALLLSSAAAFAGPHEELTAAREREHAAEVRVSYFEMQVTIAERDAQTARIIQDTASKQKNARRQADAVKQEHDAQARADVARLERARARDDLQASSDQVRRLAKR